MIVSEPAAIVEQIASSSFLLLAMTGRGVHFLIIPIIP
jgi:hypothetical protein